MGHEWARNGMLEPWAVGDQKHCFGACIGGCILYHCVELGNEDTWVIVRLTIISSKGAVYAHSRGVTFVPT